MDNWVESIKREDFIEIEEENFGTPISIIFWPYWGVEFIVKECKVVASSNVIDRQTLAGSRCVELELISEEVIIRVKVLL